MSINALLVLLFSAAALAQQRDPCVKFPCPCGEHCTAPADAPYCIPDAGRCKVTTSYLHGEMDNFAPPDDPTAPSAALLTVLGPSRSQYDTPGCNRHFGDSFTIPSCLLCKFCGAKVEIHLKPCGGSDPTNDNYTIGVAPFGSGDTIASGRIWPTGTPAETTLVINLDPTKLNQLFCKGRQARPPLDVYLEDDVIVDWVRLTIYSQ
jgi:hypothetical protein